MALPHKTGSLRYLRRPRDATPLNLSQQSGWVDGRPIALEEGTLPRSWQTMDLGSMPPPAWLHFLPWGGLRCLFPISFPFHFVGPHHRRLGLLGLVQPGGRTVVSSAPELVVFFFHRHSSVLLFFWVGMQRNPVGSLERLGGRGGPVVTQKDQ